MLFQEEQNASSSANYDVELLHQAEAHTELLKAGGNQAESKHSVASLVSSTAMCVILPSCLAL